MIGLGFCLEIPEGYYVRIIDKRDIFNEIYVIAPQYIKLLVEYLIAEGVFTINEMRKMFWKEQAYHLNGVMRIKI